MEKKKFLDNKLKIICTILLSIFLIISGIFITNKYVFSSTENMQSDLGADESEAFLQGNVIEQEENKSDLEITGANIVEENDIGKIDKEEVDIKKDDAEKTDIEIIDDKKNNEQKTEIENTKPDQDINNKKSEDVVQTKVLITQTENDQRIIPDKYNTGCKGDLVKINGDLDIGGITVVYSGENMVFDFFYRNKEASGKYVFENYDFSKYPIVIYHEDKVIDKKIKLVFKNCKFSTFSNGRPISDVFSYEFVNCSFCKFGGSNAVFSNCSFGGSYYDGMVPFGNITVKDSYFSNLASNDPKGNGIHSDGTQMYGHADAMVQNVRFTNCRFEIPAVQTTKSTAYVNACIMLQIEYNNGDNIVFENCIVNGGGYSIYAWSKFDKFNLSNVCFRNIRIGSAKLYGDIYYKTDENVVFENVSDQDSLYVSSVWNDDGKTHVIVSNDTGQARILRIITGNGTKEFPIAPCLGGNELRYDNSDKAFEEFPFDLDITVDISKDYVICFDVTDGCEKQIRYVSFDGKPTYYINPLDAAEGAEDPFESEEYFIEGSCGKNINYSLTKSGVLKLTGTGATYNYTSNNNAPWYDYSDKIKSVEISEGITHIGTQVFRKLYNIKSIDLPRSVTVIDANAFIGCSGLKEISMYSGITRIGKYAFGGMKLTKCIYYGSVEEWANIIIGANNDSLLSCEKMYISETS